MAGLGGADLQEIAAAVSALLLPKMKSIIDSAVSDIHRRLERLEQKVEQMLLQSLSSHSAPSMALVQSALSQQPRVNQMELVLPGNLSLSPTMRKYRRKSRSLSRAAGPDTIPSLQVTPAPAPPSALAHKAIPDEFRNIQSISVKELRKRDSALQQANLITLHFLYNRKKMAILTFSPDSTIATVKQQLNEELKKTHGLVIEKLQFTKRRLGEEESIEDLVISRDDEKSLRELDIPVLQLLHCHGINKSQQERAKTLTEKSFAQRFQPRGIDGDIRRRGDLPSSSLNAMDVPDSGSFRRKKKTSYAATRLDVQTWNKAESPSEDQTQSRSGSDQEAELEALQRLIAEDDHSFEDYQLSSNEQPRNIRPHPRPHRTDTM